MGSVKAGLITTRNQIKNHGGSRALTDYTTLYIGIGLDFNKSCDAPADAGYSRLSSVEADVRTTILSRVSRTHKGLLGNLPKCMSRDS